ncbi:IS3 family transposase [Flavobacterium flavigenum]
MSYNAVIENYFEIIKSELFYLKNTLPVNQLKEEIIEFVNYYNNDR